MVYSLNSNSENDLLDIPVLPPDEVLAASTEPVSARTRSSQPDSIPSLVPPADLSDSNETSPSLSESSLSLELDDSGEGRLQTLLEPGSYLKSNIQSALSSTSSLSLASLNLSIPSHAHFKNLIHKHEVPRKAFHASIGILTLYLYTRGIALKQVTPVLVSLLIPIATLDWIRFRHPAFNRLYCSVVGSLMRESEVEGAYNGVIFYLIGIIIVFCLFPKDVSVLSVLLLSFADTAASTFGRAFGHLTPKYGRSRKSLAGSLAAFAMGVASSAALYGYFIPVYGATVDAPGEIMWTPETSNINFEALIFIAGLVGSVSEGVNLWDLDDNLTIPVVSGVVMWCVLKLGMKTKA